MSTAANTSLFGKCVPEFNSSLVYGPECSAAASPDVLGRMLSLQEAIMLLNRAAGDLVSGSSAVWQIVDHARQYLEGELQQLLKVE